MRITARKRLSHWNDVAKNSPETRYKDNARYPHSSTKCVKVLFQKYFVITNRVIAFVNKVITLNGRLSYSNHDVIVSKRSSNINALREAVTPICNRPQLILKDHDPNILHHPLNLSRGTLDIISKCNFRDASLSRVSTGEGYDRIRKIRHSIIQD